MPLRLLVVDDDATTLRVLVRLLGTKGYSVLACASAEEALDHLRSGDVDVLLTDHVLPGMTGGDLARAALALPRAPRCLVMSGHARPDGVPPEVRWLRKPLVADTLLDAVGG